MGRERTSRYLSDAPVSGSLAPGGLCASSRVTSRETGWVMTDRGSADGGLCWLDGKTCYCRLASGTTWVVLTKTNPVRASLAPLPGDARIQLTTIRCLGYANALRRDGPRFLLGSNLYRPAGSFDVGFPGDATMVAQFGQAPIASPLAPAFRTNTTTASPLLQAPRNVCPDRALHRSSAGARVPYPSSVGRRAPLAMAEDAAGAALLFPSTRGNLP